jgi:U32 family peptidase
MKFSPEILAPVASMEMLLAAIHAGADAVYTGVPGFNARGRTPDFSIEELAEMVAVCHLYNVQIYFALNILIFEQELKQIEDLVDSLLKLHPDAWILQDLGLAWALRKKYPQIRLHASTQTTLSSAEALLMADSLGFQRMVLPRELTLEQIQSIRHTLPNIQLEVFAHGALCVSYSGQCLTSESFGGRSANRGQCAQSCRLPYELIVDGAPYDTKGKSYLFSPLDLNALPLVEQMQATGIDCLKIEGRLKSPAYVYAACQAYSQSLKGNKPDLKQQENLDLTFSRGFHTGWLGGINHQKTSDGMRYHHLGRHCGNIVAVFKDHLLAKIHSLPTQGDGLVFCNEVFQEVAGGRLYHIDQEAQGFHRIELEYDFPYHTLQKDFKIFINHSPSRLKELEQGWMNRIHHKTIGLNAKVFLQRDGKLVLELLATDGVSVSVATESPLELAQKRSLTAELFKSELDRWGATPYHLNQLDWAVDKPVFMQSKDVRTLRQRAVTALNAARLTRPVLRSCGAFPLSKPTPKVAAPHFELSVLIRDAAVLNDLAGLPLSCVLLDLPYGKDVVRGVEQIRSMGFKAGIASLRIHKPNENHHFLVLDKAKPDFILVRNLGVLRYYKGHPGLIGDYSLNITNSLSSRWYLEQGLQVQTPGFDLNSTQILDLIQASPAQFEVPLLHYLPTFHMEHCVFAACMSNGADYRTCGKPCESHKVQVKDHRGHLHTLHSDSECRNTLFHGQAHSGVRLLPNLKKSGVTKYRLETLNESGSEVRKRLKAIHAHLAGLSTEDALNQILGSTLDYGITEGQLFNSNNYNPRKKVLETKVLPLPRL